MYPKCTFLTFLQLRHPREDTFRARDNVLRVVALLPIEYVLRVAALLPVEYVLRVAALLPIEYVLRLYPDCTDNSREVSSGVVV